MHFQMQQFDLKISGREKAYCLETKDTYQRKIILSKLRNRPSRSARKLQGVSVAKVNILLQIKIKIKGRISQHVSNILSHRCIFQKQGFTACG